MSQQPPGGSPAQWSADGNWWWDGNKWLPAAQAPAQQQAAQSPSASPVLQPAIATGAGAAQVRKGHLGRNLAIGCGALIVLIVGLGIIGSLASQSGSGKSASSATPTPTSTATAKATATPAPKPTATPVPAGPAPIAFSGTGPQTPHFTVTSGLAVISANCACSGNFSVELDDGTGQTKDIPINVIGNYAGSVGEGLSAGDYILKVDADAAWNITITQPRNVAGASLSLTYAKTSQQIVGPFQAGSAIGIAAENAGSGNFTVSVLDRDGALQDIPINVIGNYNGSTISNNLSNGPFYGGRVPQVL